MSGLRCWPGALAIVVRAKLPENVGIVVRCIEVIRMCPDRGAMWLSESLRPGPTVWVHNEKPTGGLHYRSLSPDAWLIPITPPPGTESTPTTADKPQPVEA